MKNWLVCILSIPGREETLDAIMNALKNKVDFYVHAGKGTSGEKRNECIRRARYRGYQYISWIDDDDAITEDYASMILSALKSSPDLVSFDLSALWCKQVWSFRSGVNDGLAIDRYNKLYCANHLCCWKLSAIGDYSFPRDLGYGDDQIWYKSLKVANVVKTEVHLNKVLYHYNYQADVTANQSQTKRSLAMANWRETRVNLKHNAIRRMDGRWFNINGPIGGRLSTDFIIGVR